MTAGHIFISHATADDPFVRDLRQALESLGLTVWMDSRNLRGGDKLARQVEQAIEEARQVIVVLSPHTINSPWVRREIGKVLEVEKRRRDEDYRVIPLLLPGVEPAALPLWFDEEPLAVPIELKIGGLSEALPALLAALGERLPTDRETMPAVAPQPVEELVLELRDPKVALREGKRQVTATATLVYQPAHTAARDVESSRYLFTAPLGPIELDELRWYLEEYTLWPTGVFKERAERIEAQLPQWGRALYQAALGAPAAQDALTAWRQAADSVERRFSVWVDSELPADSREEDQAAAREAASDLLSLPWELLRDDRGVLFRGKDAVGVRRRLPNRRQQSIRLTELPIRILLVSPRPEDEHARYFDHRASGLPLVEAVENLGELVELTVLTPPTFPALEEALRRADEAGQPFDVVHFDGHGVYDRKLGLGALCFEDPKDTGKLERRGMQQVHAQKLAEVIRGYRIPLVFLDACQTARVEEDPTASVAAKLLDEGVTSVVAMSHSVLVETARRFVQAFYAELAQGAPVGKAMLAGQLALSGDTHRGAVMGAGELHLQDWFVPVLYQEERDPQLITALPPQTVRRLQARQRRLSLGDLPEAPPHTFIGRSRELLALERLLQAEPYAVLRGPGGIGKTTLAAELARWLLRSGRFRRAAFASLETYTDARGMLDTLGRQLLPDGDRYSVAQYPSLEKALQPVQRALADQSTIVVLDNLESVLPDAAGQVPPGAAPLEELFDLCRALLDAHGATRLLFTSRERLPSPFDDGRMPPLGALTRDDAVKLVEQVMAREGWQPPATDPGATPQEITDLVEAVHCHPRPLVLLAREVGQRKGGVRATTDNLHGLMRELHEKHPDDRERSLFASVELSLRRLPAAMRQQVNVLAVFHGGANMAVLALMLDGDADAAGNMAAALIDVGLGEDMGYGHLRLDPALPAYLLEELDEAERDALRARWGQAMVQLTGFLYEQIFKAAQLAFGLTLLELPNLLRMLAWAQENLPPEQMVGLAGQMETLLAQLGRPQALAQATQVREGAAQALGQWSHARYLTESANVRRLLERGDLPGAHVAARQLLQRCLAGGEGAYPGAAYDIAMAHFSLGRVLRFMGAAEAALAPLAEAQQRSQRLADAGNTSAARMASAAITESADCLTDLGRLDEAAAGYQEAIRRFEKLGDRRWVAVSKGQLGTVRMLQGRYAEALKAHAEARDIFEGLGEPRTVATAWHQIAMVHRSACQYDQAERAYRQSLARRVRLKDRAGECDTLTELGNLYVEMERLEEAVTFYRQAIDIDIGLGDLRDEGIDRSNLASVLIKLGRTDEARRELERAIKCNEPFGHAAKPWKTWDILHDLEREAGDPQAAAHARQQAVQTYLAYRRAGGESRRPGAQLCAQIAQDIQRGDTTEAKRFLAQAATAPDTPAWLKAMIPKLQAILRGSRDPALATDPNLDFRDAVELQLLLEALGS